LAALYPSLRTVVGVIRRDFPLFLFLPHWRASRASVLGARSSSPSREVASVPWRKPFVFSGGRLFLLSLRQKASILPFLAYCRNDQPPSFSSFPFLADLLPNLFPFSRRGTPPPIVLFFSSPTIAAVVAVFSFPPSYPSFVHGNAPFLRRTTVGSLAYYCPPFAKRSLFFFPPFPFFLFFMRDRRVLPSPSKPVLPPCRFAASSFLRWAVHMSSLLLSDGVVRPPVEPLLPSETGHLLFHLPKARPLSNPRSCSFFFLRTNSPFPSLGLGG